MLNLTRDKDILPGLCWLPGGPSPRPGETPLRRSPLCLLRLLPGGSRADRQNSRHFLLPVDPTTPRPPGTS